MDENIRDERVETLDNSQPTAQQPEAPAEVQPTAQQPVAPAEVQPTTTVTGNPYAAANQQPATGAAKPGFAESVKAFAQKLGKKAIITIAAVVGVVVIGGVAAAAAAGGSPVGKVMKGAEETIVSLEKLPILEVFNDVLNGGSIEVTMNTKELSDDELDMDVTAKLYTDAAAKKFAVDAKVDLEGSELAANAWIDEEDIIVQCEDLLDDAYGISLKELQENLEDSAVLEMIGIDMDELTASMELVSEMEIDEKTMLALQEDTTDLVEKVLKQFAKSVQEYAEIEKGKKELSFNGEKVNTKTIEITVDGEQLAEIIYEVAEYLSESKDLSALLEEYVVLIEDYSAALEEEVDADEMIDEVYEALDMLMDESDTIADELEEVEFNVVAYLNSGALVGVDFAVEEEGDDELKVSVKAGPTLEDLKEISVTIEEYDSKTSVVYAVDADDSKSYEATLKVREDGEVVASGSISWDKKAGDYKCKFTETNYDWWDEEEYTDEYTISGSLLKEKDCYNLELKKVIYKDGYYDEEEEIKLGIDICFDTSDKQPSKPDYVEVLTMTEDELTELAEDLVTEVMDTFDLFNMW